MSETPETPKVDQPERKPSKLSRIKSNAVMAAWIAVPVALTGGSIFVAYRQAAMNLETARLNLETARLNNPS